MSGQSTFFGGVNVTAGGLVIGANSTPTTVGGPVSRGPLGLGTLRMADGTSLFVDNASRTVANAAEFDGDVVFNNTGTSAVTMTLNGPLMLADGAVTMTVVTPNLTTALGGAIGSSATDIIKEGLGTLVLGNAGNAFTGKIIVNEGTLSIANDGALGVLPGAFLADAITLNNGGAFGSSATTTLDVNRGITLNGGGGLSPNSGTVLTIAGTISGTGGLSMIGAGTAVLAGNNTYTGVTTVSSGTLLLLGANAVNGPVYALPGGTLALANDASALNGQPLFVNGGSLGLFWDGDGRGTQETYAFPTVTPPANFIGNFGLTVDRIGTTAANKTIQYALSDLPVITDQIITVTNLNGYGLELTGDLTLGTGGGTPTFNVVTTTGSNVVQGLTLNGQVSGTSGFTKSGNGTLVLGNAGNSFAGDIDINQGVVSVANDGQLGAAANKVVLSPTTGTATFRVTDDITMNNRVIQLANTANTRAIEVVGGKTLTMNTAFDLNGSAGAAAALVKADQGTLLLNTANSGWSGTLTINGGVVRLANDDAAGSGLIRIGATFGAALQLAGVTLGNTIDLETSNNAVFGGIQSGGTVQAVSGVNNLDGTLNLTFDSIVGADEGATLNINGTIVAGATLRQMIFTGAGDINVNSVLPQFHTLNKTGSGTLTITSVNTATTTSGGLRVQSGELVLSGAGTYTGATQGIIVSSGGTLSLVDTGTPVANRLGGRNVTINGGIFNYTVSETGASAETNGVLTFGIGGAGFNVLNAGAQTGTLTFASLALGAGSSVNFTGTLGSTNKILFGTAPVLIPSGAGVLARALVNEMDFATYNATEGLVAFTAYNTSNDLDGALASDVMSLNTSAAITSTRTLAALKFDGSNITIGGASGTVLTLTSGGILVTGSNNALNVPVLTLGAEGIFHVLDGASLEVGSAITGTAGINKADGGTLTLNAINFATGTTYVTGGTLVLDAGTNTLNADTALSVGLQSMVDLRGNAQFVNTLSTSGVGVTHNGGTGGASEGGVITSTDGPATLVTNMGANATFAGQITGEVTFGRAGGNTLTMSSDNTYTGKTVLNGGTTVLLGAGRLSGTSAIEINNATLTLNNQGLLDLGDRLNDAAAITLNSGTLSFLARPQTDSSETVGAVTLGSGFSTINSQLGGTGINSSTLTLTDFIRSNVDTMVNFTGTNLGVLGSTSRIQIASYAANIDFLGPWAVVNGTEYAGYDANYGVGALNAVGFVGYDGTALTGENQPTHNIRLTAGDYAVSEDAEINTLNLNGNVNLSFVRDNALQRYPIINLVGGGLLKSGSSGNTIGEFAGHGTITAGGSSAASLYLFNQQNTLIVFSSIVDNGGGAVRLVANGGGVIRLAGFNTYTGGTVVNGGTVTVDNFLPNGGVTVNNGVLTVGQGDGISSGIGSNNVITLNGGVLNLTMENTLAGLILNSNGPTTTSVNTGGVLTLTGGITSTPTSVSQVAAIHGILDFNGANRTVAVDSTRVDGVDVAPWQAGLNITAEILNGGIIKTGAGVLQLSSNASTFAGGVNVQSGSLIIGASSMPSAPGTSPTSGPLGTGTLTLGAGTTLLSTGNFALSNAVIINGDFTFAGAANLQLNGPITLNQTVGDPTQIKITVVNPVMTATLGGDITGTVTNINKLGLGTLVVNPNYGGTVTSGGGALSLLTDGDGTSSRETIQFGGITLTGPTTLNVGRLGTERFPNFTLAANKTIRINNLITNGNALTVNNPSGGTTAGNGGYGLEISGPTTLAADQTYIVTTATASDVVQGLTLSGVVSGPGGIIKRGNGTLVLGNDANSFGGAGKLIDIQTGVVSVATDGALGDDANIVRFNSSTFSGVGNTALNSTTITVSSTAGLVVGASVFGATIPAEAVITSIASATTFVISAPATAAAAGTALTFANPTTLRATESFATSRIFQFVAEAGSGETGAEALFEVVGGKTLTLNSPFDLSLNAAGNIAKGNNGTLVLNAANPGWDGILTIYGGAVQVGTANALGSTVGGVVVRSTEAALQLVNGVTLADKLTLYGSGFDTAGALQGRGAVTNTASGAITLGGAASIGADAGSTLNITGGISGAQALTLASQGDINITTNPLGAVTSVTTFGSGTTALEVASPAFVGTVTVSEGDFVIRGDGSTGGVGTITLVSSGRLVIDNSATNIVDRFGGGSRDVTSIDGAILFIGHDSEVSSERFDTLTLGSRGQTRITINAGATGEANLRFNSVTRNERSTLRIQSDSLSATTGAGNATLSLGSGAPTAGTGANGTRTKTILPWAVVHDTSTNTYSFAALDGGFVRALGGLASGEVVSTLTSGANVQMSAALATTGSTSFNSLTLGNGAALTINGGTTLTLGTSNSLGGILALPGSSTIGGNGNGTGVITTGNNAELLIHTVGDLTIDSTIGTSSGGLSKNGVGTLTLNEAVIRTGNFSINEGTVKLNGGTNTMWFNQNVMVNDGGVLDLFGNSQHFAILLTDGAAVANGGGIITNSHPTDQATLVINSDNTARNWTGSITGNISFQRAGQNTVSFYSDNDYTGITQLSGGTTLLRDEGQLSNTTAIDINYAALTLDNAGTINLTDRVNDAAAITLRGGNLTFQGRTQTNSTESLGTVTLAEGYSNILSTAGGTGVNSAALTLASLVQGSPDAVVNFNGSGGGGQLGQIGSNPRILITDAPVLVNNIIGGWAIINGQEFASYSADFGVGSLTQTGFAGYDVALAGVVPETLLPTDNVRATSSFAVPSSGITINSLSLRGTFDTNFNSADSVLNVVSGGVIANRTNSRMGNTVDEGRLTAGGAQSSGTASLYLYNTLNTYTVNVRIIDNPNGADVRLVLSAAGGAISIANPFNTYTGGTVVNGGTVNLASPLEGFGPVIPLGTDGLTINGATVTMQTFAGQIDAGNVVTLNGSSILNLIGDNTLAGIVFNTSGTGTGVVTPTVNTGTDGTGILTLTGDIFSNPSTVTTTATIFGRMDLGATARTITVEPILFNGGDISPLLAGLSIQGVVNSTGGFIKEGAGVLEFDGQTTYSGATLVNEGTIQIGSVNAGSRFSDYTLADGARLNLNGQSTTLGSLAGAGTVTNSGSAQTLTVGYNGASTTFSGQFERYSDAVLNAVNVAKIGSGTWTLTGSRDANFSSGTLTVSEGEVVYNGGGTGLLTTHLVQAGGTLTLENGVTNTNDRLAGTTLNIGGGLVQIRGNAGVATNETVNTLTISGGTGTLLLEPVGGQDLTFTANAMSGVQAGGTLVLRSLPGANFQVTTLNQPGSQGTGLNGTTNMLIRPDIIGDSSAHALADLDGTTAFVTRDSETANLRPLTALEMEATLSNSSTTNFSLSANATFDADQAANSLRLENGVTLTSLRDGSPASLAADGSLLTQTITTGGLLALSGDSFLNFGLLATSNNTPFYFYTLGAATSVTVNALLSNSSGGLIKSGDGTLSLNQSALYSGTTAINGGTMILNGGPNTIRVVAGATAASLSALQANGGVLDLNGNNQAFGTLSSNNPLPNTGATITNSAAGSPITLVTSNTATSVFGGQITGNLNFTKSGNGALTLTSANTYTGETIIRANTLVLRDDGALLNTSAVSLFFGNLTLDNLGLAAVDQSNPQRLPDNVPLTIRGGTLTLNGAGSTHADFILGDVTMGQGSSTINLAPAVNSGANSTLTINNLIREFGGTVHFTNSSSTGSLGDATYNGAQIFLNQVNGAAPMDGGFLGAWAVVNSGDFAHYLSNRGVARYGQAGFPGYSGTFVSGAITNISGNVTIGAAGSPGTILVGALRLSGAATRTLSFANATDTLNIETGGLLSSNENNARVIGSTTTRGIVTAGGSASSGVVELVVGQNQNTMTIHSVIADNASGAAVALVKTLGGSLTLTAENSFTGGTIVDQGTLNLSASTAGWVVLPGDLAINNATVTMNTHAQQIAATSDVTFSGGGSLNLEGANTLNSITWNNIGGTSNPTVNTDGALTLTSTNGLTAYNDNFATTPILAGAWALGSDITQTVTTWGTAPTSLQISAAITGTGTSGLTKEGSGALLLSNNGGNDWSGDTTINAGTLRLGSANPLPSTSLLVINANGFLDVNGQTMATAAGSLTGLGTITNDANATATLFFGGDNASATFAGRITNIPTNALNIAKGGTGTQTFTGTNNNYTGTTSVRNGTIVVGAENTLSTVGALVLGNNLTGANSTQGILDMTNFSQAVGGLLVQSDSATANQLLIGAAATLTITGNVIIGENVAPSPAAVTITRLDAVGGGTVTVNNQSAGAVFAVGGYTGATTGVGNSATADFSGLSALNIFLNTTDGLLRIGSPSGTNVSGVFSTLILATDSTITANAITVGAGGQYNGTAGQVNALKLGSGLTTLNVNTWNVGTGSRDFGAVSFDVLTGSLVVRAADGVGRAALNLGTGTANTGVGSSTNVNTIDLRGHNADLLLDAVVIGSQARAQAYSNAFYFGDGVLDMNSLSLSLRDANTSGNGAGAPRTTNSLFDISGGLVEIRNGILAAGRVTGINGTAADVNRTANATINFSGDAVVNVGATAGTAISMAGTSVAGSFANATVNITGNALVTLAGDIVREGGAGTTTALVNLNGGTLDLTGNDIGSANTVALTLASGTLRNVGQINAGGAIAKTTAGTLNFEGTNTYTGATAVDEGTLVVGGTLNGTASVYVGGGVNPAVLTATGTLTSPTFDVVNNGRLSGSGTLNGAVTVESGGTLAPDAAPSGLTINTGSLAFEGGSTFALSLANSNGAGQPLDADYSKLTLGTGVAADLNGTIFADGSGSLNANDLFTVILSGTAVNGIFTNTTLVSGSTYAFSSDGWDFLINYAFDDATFDGSLASFQSISGGTNVALLVVPEPNALTMLAGSLGFALGLQRFRRRRAAVAG